MKNLFIAFIIMYFKNTLVNFEVLLGFRAVTNNRPIKLSDTREYQSGIKRKINSNKEVIVGILFQETLLEQDKI